VKPRGRLRAGPDLNGPCIVARLLVRSSYMSPACFEVQRRLPACNRSPPKRSAKASVSSDLAKQNTTNSLSSRRREPLGDDALGAKPTRMGEHAIFAISLPNRSKAD
jgi:hypothetical protein